MIWLVQDDALGEWSSIARLDVKLNSLTFDERLTTFSLNLRVVHKDVGLAVNSDESPTLFVVEPLDGSYSHCGPPCFFWYRFAPVPEGTTTATSTTKPTGEPLDLQIFLGTSNEGARRRVLDHPSQCDQFVTKSIGLGPVLGRTSAVTPRHQVSTVRIDDILFRVKRKSQSSEERIYRHRNVLCPRRIAVVGRAIGGGERVEEQSDRERRVQVVVENCTDLFQQRRSIALPTVIRSHFKRVTSERRQFESSRQGIQTGQGAFGVGDRGRRDFDRRTVVRPEHEQSIGPRV